MKLNQEISILRKYKTLSDKEKLPFIFCAIVIIGVLIGCLVCMVNTILEKPLFPYGTFVFMINRYTDLLTSLNVSLMGSAMNDSINLGANYFPFHYLFFYPLANLNWILVLYASLGFFILFTFFYIKRSFVKSSIGIMMALTILFSYPFLYAYDRMNTEVFLFIFFVCFIICYKKQFLLLSSFILAILISMKLYPAVLFVLFIQKKQWKYLFYCVFTTLFLTYFGYLYTGSNLDGILLNFKSFNFQFQLFPLGMIFGHSLFNLIRVPLLFFTKVPNLIEYIQWVQSTQIIYAILMFMFFSFISLYLVFINKKFWKCILILFLVLVSFPYISQDYTLIHLTIPLLLLLNAEYAPMHKIYVILLALLFIPMNWITWAYPNIYLNVTAIWCYPITPGLVLRPIIILILLYLLMREDYTWANLKKGIAWYLERSK